MSAFRCRPVTTRRRAWAVAAAWLMVFVASDLACADGPTTEQVIAAARGNAEDPEWPPRGRFSPLGGRLYRRYGILNQRLWERRGFLYLVAPTVMAQQGTQGGPSDFTANEQVQVAAAWQFVRKSRVGDVMIVMDFLHVSQVTNTTGVDFTSSLGTSFFSSDSVGETNIFRALALRHDLPRGMGTIILGHANSADVDSGTRYAQDDTQSFIGQLLSSSPVRQMPGAGTGIGIDVPFSDGWTFEAHASDANGDGTLDDPLRVFRTGEVVVVGAVKRENPLPRHGDGHYKVSGYYVPETATGTPDAKPSGWGIHLQLDQDFGNFGTFVKAGAASGRVGFVDRYATGGVVWKRPFGCSEDWLGLGLGAARPTAPASNTEFAAEAFWRVQLTPFVAITPDVQLVFNPSRSSADVEAIFTLRARAAL